ncbi:hypothetical protein Q31b_37840 [Novipirellula aureliae]|uniref:RanBP2-type domain-containing protein n=1 Tax=Novipirellula aureliae TaxID=2527966 RepID=A0A5C6DUI4_9BACT|nr:hypothetical protein [Novipirellula aureliae]TWU38706.1 hypothetical protein Q31b_37840 [Novipirellula aureliae]
MVVKLPAFLVDYVEVGLQGEDGAIPLPIDEDDDLYSPDETGTKWKCENCGELNASSFDLCWQCQHEYGEPPQ